MLGPPHSIAWPSEPLLMGNVRSIHTSHTFLTVPAKVQAPAFCSSTSGSGLFKREVHVNHCFCVATPCFGSRGSGSSSAWPRRRFATSCFLAAPALMLCLTRGSRGRRGRLPSGMLTALLGQCSGLLQDYCCALGLEDGFYTKGALLNLG